MAIRRDGALDVYQEWGGMGHLIGTRNGRDGAPDGYQEWGGKGLWVEKKMGGAGVYGRGGRVWERWVPVAQSGQRYTLNFLC